MAVIHDDTITVLHARLICRRIRRDIEHTECLGRNLVERQPVPFGVKWFVYALVGRERRRARVKIDRHGKTVENLRADVPRNRTGSKRTSARIGYFHRRPIERRPSEHERRGAIVFEADFSADSARRSVRDARFGEQSVRPVSIAKIPVTPSIVAST